jgi:hypothetical protein
MKKRGQFLILIHTQPINIDIEKFLGRKAILKKCQQRSQGKKAADSCTYKAEIAVQ